MMKEKTFILGPVLDPFLILALYIMIITLEGDFFYFDKINKMLMYGILVHYYKNICMFRSFKTSCWMLEVRICVNDDTGL